MAVFASERLVALVIELGAEFQIFAASILKLCSAIWRRAVSLKILLFFALTGGQNVACVFSNMQQKPKYTLQ